MLKVLGLDLLRVGPPNNRECCPDESSFFGVGKRLILAIRKAKPAPTIDHYALLMTNFNKDAVIKELGARGASTRKTRPASTWWTRTASRFSSWASLARHEAPP